MANSKIFRSAQNRSPGMGSSVGGYFSFESGIKAIQKTQVKKCEPYSLLREVSKKTGIKTSEMYLKIVFSNMYGQIKILVSAGKNKDQASANDSFLVIADVLKNQIRTIVPLSKKKNDSAAKQKSKNTSGNSTRRGGATSGSRRKSSRRFRKRTRKNNRRSRLRKANRTPAKDQIVLEDFYETAGAVVPQQFNTPNASVQPRDFASIFEDANNDLYNEDALGDISVDNPPGVAKFIGLGVNIDRPSVIASTELSPIIYDDTLDVYEQLLLDRKFRIETVYNNLQKVDEEDTEKMLELLAEFKLLTEDAINSTALIALIDDQLINEISTEMQDLAAVLGFDTSVSMSQLYVQTLNDLGKYSAVGTYKTERGTRSLSLKENEINIDEQYQTYKFTGGNAFRTGFLQNGGRNKLPTDASNYGYGNTGTYLGFYDDIDSEYIRKAGGTKNAGNSSVSIRTSTGNAWLLDIQTVYFELMMSRLIDISDSNALAIKEMGYHNIVRAFLGDFSDPRASLNDIAVPSQLASIVKYNSAGENYYPLEQFISDGGGLSGRTFLDAVVQPAVGAVIEETDPNFDLLNAWVENANSNLEQYFKYIDAASLDGGAGIVLNEIVLGIVKCISDRNAKIGYRKHPKSSSMQLYNNRLTSENIASILSRGSKYFANRDNVTLGHLYNTFGYTFFKGQNELINDLGNRSTTGLYKSGISYATYSYGISSAWNDSASRAINDGQAVSEIANNIYEEFARLFNLIENNLMTSIDLLLSDAGLLSLTESPTYNTDTSDSYFDEVSATVPKPSLLPSGVSPGNYEATKFSGMPRFYIRALLANAVHKMMSKIGAFDTNIIKAAKVAVENLDPELGPVRWKMTHGTWPLEDADFEDLDSDLYNALVPEEVRDALAGNVEVDIDTDSDGNIESINVENPAEGWEFIESTEGFCPLTLVLEGEDNSEDNISLVKANRALFDNIYDDLMTDRTRLYKMKQFLQKPVTAFSVFPETLEETVGNLSLDSIMQAAQLPSIDGQALVKFTSENQIANMKRSLKLEAPSEELRYLPNKFVSSDSEYLVARKFIDDYMEKNFSDQQKCIVQTVGIPTGLLSSAKVSDEVFSLTREAEYMFFPENEWSEKKNLFHPAVYLIPGSFTSVGEDSSYTMMVENAKYLIADKSVSSMMTYSEATDYLGLSDDDATEVFTNHCLDYSLQLSLKLTTGMVLDEDTFRLDSNSKRLFVSSDGQKNIETLLSTVPEGFDSIFSDNGIDRASTVAGKLTDSTTSEINMYLGSLECRLITPEEITKQVLSTRIFDRVISMFAHPDEHYTEATATGLKAISKTFDGESKTVYQIDLNEGSENSVKNDHFASYYYKVE